MASQDIKFPEPEIKLSDLLPQHQEKIKDGDWHGFKNWLFDSGNIAKHFANFTNRKDIFAFREEFLLSFKFISQNADLGICPADCAAEVENFLGKYFIVQSNIAESIKWFEKSAERGNIESQERMSYLCFMHRATHPAYPDKAFKYAQQASESGSLNGETNLAECYFEGIGVEADKVKGIEILKKLEKQGFQPAIVNLATCYMYGKGVSKDEIKGLKLLFAMSVNNIHPDNPGANANTASQEASGITQYYKSRTVRGAVTILVNAYKKAGVTLTARDVDAIFKPLVPQIKAEIVEFDSRQKPALGGS